MSKPLPASRRQRIDTTFANEPSRVILLPGPAPRLLWQGRVSMGYKIAGYVKVEDVLKLRDMCEAILARRKLEKRKP